MPNPHDFTAGDVLTAAQMDTIANRVISDTTSGARPSAPFEGMTIYETDTNRVLIYDGASWCQINTAASTVSASETTTSATYADLATVGPAVTITTGTKAWINFGCYLQNSSGSVPLSTASFAISGATTVAATDLYAIQFNGAGATYQTAQSYAVLITGLTAGNNTFTMKYKTNTGTLTVKNRHIGGCALL